MDGNSPILSLLEENEMKLSEPKVITYIIAVVIALVGILAYFLKFLGADIAVIILVVGFVLLALANLLKGL
jgi:hypothetical protein